MRTEGNKLIDFLNWTRGNGGVSRFREFRSVIEVHYYLLGYQMSESDNEISDGHGDWISDFMIFCEQETSKEIQKLTDSKKPPESGSYYSYIMSIQKNNNDGLSKLYRLFDKFIQSRVILT